MNIAIKVEPRDGRYGAFAYDAGSYRDIAWAYDDTEVLALECLQDRLAKQIAESTEALKLVRLEIAARNGMVEK